MSLADVRNVALREKHSQDPTTNTVVRNEKCSQLSVLLVEKRLKSLSNHQVINRFIVVIVTNHAHEIIGNCLKEAAFLGCNTREAALFQAFLFVKQLARMYLITLIIDIHFYK
ncbi:hypothetical protein A7K50_07260 [Dehalobacter sp. MCB1]|nr:hypothetical protein A7K50_07260 [Dehalobacter sp. MCB1]